MCVSESLDVFLLGVSGQLGATRGVDSVSLSVCDLRGVVALLLWLLAPSYSGTVVDTITL